VKVISKSESLARDVIKLVKTMDKLDQWTIGSQMIRSSVSIASNLSEGSCRTKKEFRNFIRISRGSLEELKTQLRIFGGQDRLISQCDEIGKMTHGLLLSLDTLT